MNSITINGKTLSLVCEECGGSGIVRDEWANGVMKDFQCETCQGTGQRYYTPTEFEKLTGVKISEKFLVYVIQDRLVMHDFFSDAVIWYGADKQIILAIPGQPAPPTDYRHKILH